jgi:hypothetical protein
MSAQRRTPATLSAIWSDKDISERECKPFCIAEREEKPLSPLSSLL